MSMFVLDVSTPTARKEHVCGLCHRTICAGEQYDRQRNVGDGGVYAFKVCAHCSAFLRLTDFAERADWDGEGYTAFDIGEYEPYTIAEARLLVMLRRKWARRDGTLRQVPVVGAP